MTAIKKKKRGRPPKKKPVSAPPVNATKEPTLEESLKPIEQNLENVPISPLEELMLDVPGKNRVYSREEIDGVSSIAYIVANNLTNLWDYVKRNELIDLSYKITVPVLELGKNAFVKFPLVWFVQDEGIMKEYVEQGNNNFERADVFYFHDFATETVRNLPSFKRVYNDTETNRYCLSYLDTLKEFYGLDPVSRAQVFAYEILENGNLMV